MATVKGTSAPVEEFNTNVPDKDERKKARKKRIDKRNATETTNAEEVNEADQSSQKTGLQQVSDSIFHLDRRKYDGLKDVTTIRVATDDAESKRRVVEEDTRRDRLGKLQHEALTSAKANASIEMKWAELLEKDIPQELHQEIQEQMGACNSIVKSKDGLIGEFQRQLRSKDEEYVRTLRKQSEDVDDLLSRIRREFKEMQTEYERELEAIEEAYLEERERTIAEYSGELDSMFDLRKAKETHYKEAKQKREEQYQKEIEELITKGADNYNKLKIDLEKNIQTLKEQLEEIRATYQLNTEKLDYNYRVLTELDVEKNAELARYKRRLTKLKDQLNQLVARYTDLEAADSRTNSDLTDDYRTLTQKYKDLQAKFRHFEVADTNKYDDVWAMHEEEAKDMLDQLLKADKIISEQQLGWNWKAPDLNALETILGRRGNLVAQTPAASNNNDLADLVTAAAAGPSGPGGVSGTGTVRLDVVGEEGSPRAGEGDEGDDNSSVTPAAASIISDANEKQKRNIAGARIRGMLRLLATEAGFLVNAQVQQSLEEMAVSTDEANLVRAEAMLKALGVKSQDKLNTLLSYFFRDTPQGQTVSTEPVDVNEGNEEELLLHYASEDVAELKEMIRPEDVINAVRAYIEDMSVDVIGAPGAGGAKNTEEDQRIGQKRLNGMRNYWAQLAQIVSDDNVEVWRQLDKEMQKMKELLERRSQTITEVDQMARKNAELKRLLNQYLGDMNVNRTFQVPPAQVMRVRDVPVAAPKSSLIVTKTTVAPGLAPTVGPLTGAGFGKKSAGGGAGSGAGLGGPVSQQQGSGYIGGKNNNKVLSQTR